MSESLYSVCAPAKKVLFHSTDFAVIPLRSLVRIHAQ